VRADESDPEPSVPLVAPSGASEAPSFSSDAAPSCAPFAGNAAIDTKSTG
jgi:hypothetical protein